MQRRTYTAHISRSVWVSVTVTGVIPWPNTDTAWRIQDLRYIMVYHRAAAAAVYNEAKGPKLETWKTDSGEVEFLEGAASHLPSPTS